MTRRRLSRSERFGVWKVWNGMCFWCREPVMFSACQIDHVIPLNAVSEAEAATHVRILYNLPDNFDFDHFENFVPAHGPCNRAKSFDLPDPSPAFLLYLNQVRSKASLADAVTETILRDAKKEKILTLIETAASQGDITEADITSLFKNLPSLIRKSANFNELTELFIAPGWKVVQERGHLLHVVAENGRFGMTSSSGDPSWTCSRCGHNGPWSGVICLTCGNREAPD